MRIEEYGCVKIKRRAQARISEQTKTSHPRNWSRMTSGSAPPPAARHHPEALHAA